MSAFLALLSHASASVPAASYNQVSHTFGAVGASPTVPKVLMFVIENGELQGVENASSVAWPLLDSTLDSWQYLDSPGSMLPPNTATLGTGWSVNLSAAVGQTLSGAVCYTLDPSKPVKNYITVQMTGSGLTIYHPFTFAVHISSYCIGFKVGTEYSTCERGVFTVAMRPADGKVRNKGLSGPVGTQLTSKCFLGQ